MREIVPENGDVIFYPSIHTWTENKQTTSFGDQNQHRFVLRIDEELIFQRNVINLIVGPTASGKTSILMALLGQHLVNWVMSPSLNVYFN